MVRADAEVTADPHPAAPWINTSLVLHGDGDSSVASTWLGAHRRLRGALRSAGFSLEEATTWFSMGDRLARP